MKALLLFILLLGICRLSAESDRGTISLRSSFPEGFGMLIKREFQLKKIKTDPKSKGGEVENIYIILNAGSEDESTLLLEAPKDIRTKLEKAFGNKLTIKITGIGYETIDSTGFPGISESVKDEEDANVLVPAGHGWMVKKIFQLWSFTVP